MKRLAIIFLLLVALALIVSLALAQNDHLQLPWHTIAGGGHVEDDAGRFAVDGTMGLAVTGSTSADPRFQVEGGFIAGLPDSESEYAIYIPLILRR